MTLDEMLALLPDNTTGDITPADLRQIITSLYRRAGTMGDSQPFQWITSGVPGSGKTTLDLGWTINSTKLLISETGSDDVTRSFNVIDGATEAHCWIATKDGDQFEADIIGPSVDLGTYREIPIRPLEIIGVAPSNNENVTVTLAAILA